jgi:Na+/H+-dicarboxylate symporter
VICLPLRFISALRAATPSVFSSKSSSHVLCLSLTYISDAENIIDTRALCAVSDSDEELEE